MYQRIPPESHTFTWVRLLSQPIVAKMMVSHTA